MEYLVYFVQLTKNWNKIPQWKKANPRTYIQRTDAFEIKFRIYGKITVKFSYF